MKANGHKSCKAWKKAWQDKRDGTFKLVGHAKVPDGNDVAKISVGPDGRFDLELRLRPSLVHLATNVYEVKALKVHSIASITLRNLHFNVGHAAIAEGWRTASR